MATFAELILETIDENGYYRHTGVVTKYDHKNKIIYVDPEKSHIKTTARKYAKYGATAGFLAGGRSKFGDNKLGDKLGGRFGTSAIGAGVGAGTGALIGAYQRNKEKKKVYGLMRAGYKLQYAE